MFDVFASTQTELTQIPKKAVETRHFFIIGMLKIDLGLNEIQIIELTSQISQNRSKKNSIIKEENPAALITCSPELCCPPFFEQSNFRIIRNLNSKFDYIQYIIRSQV